MLRRHHFWFRTALMLADAAIAVGLLVLVSWLRFGQDWLEIWEGLFPQPAVVLGIYAGGWVLALTSVGLYRPRARWSLRSEAIDVLRATVVMSLASLSILFLFKLPDVSRLFLLILFPAQALVTVVERAVLRKTLERWRVRGRNTRHVLVLGAGPRGQAFAAKIEAHRELGLSVIGFLDSDPAFRAAAHDAVKVLGPVEDLETILHAVVVDEVVICLPFSQWDRIDAIAGLCEEEGKIVRIPMDVMDRAIARGRVEELDGTPVFSLVSGPDRALALAIKRAIDLAGAVVVMVLLSPLLAAVALAVALGDGGPVFFRQDRVGLHGRLFRVVKFRTMTVDAEARRAELAARNVMKGQAFKVDGDPRVTRVGRFLRRTSLDELPQVWNVLRGEMSLVGPRPPLPAEVRDYDLWHRRRLSMKPGITGLWQVRGRRDPEFDHWVEADLEYIDRWSLWLDVQIMFRTIPAAFEGR
jgi:exopolysaccharide biosynthesis polyprenyl glycosylphosphotransferase